MSTLKQTLFIAFTGSFCLAGCVTMQRTDLYFGQHIPGGGQLTIQQWKDFSDSTLTPVFPDGYTETNAQGKWRDTETRATIAENTKVITIIGKRSAERNKKLNGVMQAYAHRFNQQAVLRVDTKIRYEFFTKKTAR